MARKVEVTLIDDLDGSAASESVKFALDGVQYEIDLSEDNAREFRDVLAKYIDAGTKVTASRAPRAAGSAPRAASKKSDTPLIREWAKQQGHTVSDRGRISADIVDAYYAAH